MPNFTGEGSLSFPLKLVQQDDPLTVTVTDTECKLFAKIDTTADDTIVTSLNEAATCTIEKEMAKSFVSTSWKATADGFPCDLTFTTCQRFFQICRTPLIAVSSITYIDVEGVQQTLDAADYIVDTQSEPARIVEAPGTTWPDTENRVNAVEINFTAGYGATADDVPEKFKTIVLLMFTHLYEHREVAHDKKWHLIPKHIQYMIDLFKIQVFA